MALTRIGGGLLLGALLLGAAALAGEEPPHLRLLGTHPGADSTVVGSPEEIRLIFSEPPQMRGTSVRLADSGGALVPSSEASADPDDPKEIFIRPALPLVGGRYTVHWRVIAQDGHTQRGSFDFTVASPD